MIINVTALLKIIGYNVKTKYQSIKEMYKWKGFYVILQC